MMRTRLARNAATLVLATCFVQAQQACTQMGTRFRTAADGSTIGDGSPNTLTLTDPGGQWTSNSTGPAQYTDMGPDGVQTFRQGSVPRELFWDKRTGRLVISSGTDIRASGVKLNPETGMIDVAEFATVTSEPLRAANEALDRLITYWTPREQAKLEARKAEMQAIEATAPTVASLLKDVLRAAGVPIP